MRHSAGRAGQFAFLLVVLLVPGSLVVPHIQTAHAQSVSSWNPNVSCSTSLVTIQGVLGAAYPSQSLKGSVYQTGSSGGGVPNKRALSPPCTITNTSGQVVSSFVQVNDVYLPGLTYEDCSTSYDPVNGGGPYPDKNGDGKADTFCDNTGNIKQVGTTSGQIHIEFDHDWMAKGYCGPDHSPCDNKTISQYLSSGSISLDVQGFVFWDSGSSHWELHPFTAWKLSSSPPPGPQPLATSFTYSPSNPSPAVPVFFTGAATGGVSPYTFTWNFGDSGTATGSTVSHTYSSQGNYTVTLTAVDSNRTTTNSSRTINVKTQTTYTFTPTDDTYVEQDTPTTNYGTSTEITVDNSPVKDILLKFNVQISGQVTSATLRLFQVDSSDKGGDFHTAPANWAETNATWNNAPAPNPTVFFSLGPVTTNLWYNITMTSVVTGSGIVSLRVTSSSPTGDGSHFASRERSGGAFAAQLIVVTAPSSTNTPPALTVLSLQTVNEQTPLSFTVSATDDPSQTITLSSQGLPIGASFASTPATGLVTGTFSWTPSESQGPGGYTVTFKATDSLGAVSARNVSITVNEINRPPVINVPGAQTIAVGNTLAFTVTATDSDIPPNTVALSASNLVAGMSFNSSSGLFSFTPVQYQLGQNFNVTFTATDNGVPTLSSTGVVAITVSVNPPSLTVLGSQLVNEQSPLAFAVSATDNPNRTITITCGNCASLGATFTSSPSFGAATGNFSWNPTEAQGPGTYSFSFTASNDLGGTTTRSVVVTVNEVNSSPTLTVPGAQTVNELTLLTLTVGVTDPDIPANLVTLACSNCATLGASFDPATGSFAWTPTEAQGPGNYTVTFTAIDNGSPSLFDTKSVTIIVHEANVAPVISAPTTLTAKVNSTTTFQVNATDRDIPLNTITLSVTGLVPGMSFPTITGNPVTGSFSFTPGPAQSGLTFTITFTATDNGSPIASATKTVTIIVATASSYALAITYEGKVFRYQNGTFTLIGQPVTTELRQVAWRPDGSFALIVGDSGVLLKYDDTQLTTIPTGITTNLYALAWKPDGSYALITGSGGPLFKYDGITLTRLPNPFTNSIRSISWNPSGTQALMVGSAGGMLLYQSTGQIIMISSGTTQYLYSSAWNPNGLYALAAGANNVILLYDGTSVRALNATGLYSPTVIIHAISWRPSGTFALLVGDSGVVLTYDGSRLTLVPSPASSNLYSISWLGSTGYIEGGSGPSLTYTSGVLSTLANNTSTSLRGLAWKPS